MLSIDSLKQATVSLVQAVAAANSKTSVKVFMLSLKTSYCACRYDGQLSASLLLLKIKVLASYCSKFECSALHWLQIGLRSSYAFTSIFKHIMREQQHYIHITVFTHVSILLHSELLSLSLRRS